MTRHLTGIVAIGLLVAGLTAAPGSPSVAAETITVTVQGTNITTTVGADGALTLRGLPEGGFTLVFTDSTGAALGSLTFAEVKPNQEITIVVEVGSGTVILIEEQRNGIGHGDIEIEGTVSSATPNPAGDSVFVVAGHTIVARPGQTAIRQGETRLTVEDVAVTRKLHLKGVVLSVERTVLAYEIVLDPLDDDEDDDDR